MTASLLLILVAILAVAIFLAYYLGKVRADMATVEDNLKHKQEDIDATKEIVKEVDNLSSSELADRVRKARDK